MWVARSSATSPSGGDGSGVEDEFVGGRTGAGLGEERSAIWASHSIGQPPIGRQDGGPAQFIAAVTTYRDAPDVEVSGVGRRASGVGFECCHSGRVGGWHRSASSRRSPSATSSFSSAREETLTQAVKGCHRVYAMGRNRLRDRASPSSTPPAGTASQAVRCRHMSDH